MGRLFPFASSQMLCFARDDELQARARVSLVPFPRRGNAAGTQETPISSRDSTPDSDRGVDARTARPSRAHHAPRFPTGLASANRPSRTRNLIARRLTPLRLRYGTLDLAGPKHTPCLRRDARMVATSPPARVVTCVPLPLEFPPTAIARATEPEPLGFLDRRAGLRGDRAGPSATRLDARSG